MYGGLTRYGGVNNVWRVMEEVTRYGGANNVWRG